MIRALSPGSLARIPPSYQKNFVDVPRKKDWYRWAAHGDGSCFFHSVAAAINYQDFHSHSVKSQKAIGRNLRRALQRAITDDAWSTFWARRNLLQAAPTPGEARKQIGDYKIWANLWLIVYSMYSLQLSLIFFDFKDGGRPYCGITVEAGERPTSAGNLPDCGWRLALIGWVNRSHFENIVLVTEDPDVTNPGTVRQLGETQAVAFQFEGGAAKQIIKKYNTCEQCRGIALKDIAGQNT